MLKTINNIFNINKTFVIASLQVIPSITPFTNYVAITRLRGILKYFIILFVTNYKDSKNCLKPYFYFLEDCKIYKIYTVVVAVQQITINNHSGKINDQFKSVAQTKGENGKCQKDDEPNEQHSSKGINVWLKLYSLLLNKCKYTSLELAVRSAKLKADAVANFCTANPVRVGSGENNKEQCYRLWQRQTIVDS